MTAGAERVKVSRDRIKRALAQEWDPIGVRDMPNASDEYDLYVEGIWQMLVARSGQDALFDYLWRLETEHIGLVGDRPATERFAMRLMDLIKEGPV